MNITSSILITMVVVTMVLAGCNDNKSTVSEYSVQIMNLTDNQPLAPVAVVLHQSGYHVFSAGTAASPALELLAESGDPVDIIAEANNSTNVLSTAATATATLPGENSQLTLQGTDNDTVLSLAAMLVNTNDGFIGIDTLNLGDMQRGDTLTLLTNVYDAGTEANSETTTTIPGLGGEGFNIARDDHDLIGIHPGVISMDDGLNSSGLDQSHRFDNPAARITVTRVK